jgi:hypothetical protein
MEVSTWKLFRLKDYLSKSPYKATAYNALDLIQCDKDNDNAIEYVTRTDENNGCKCYVINEDFDDIEQGNAITIGDTTATVFYHENRFICGDHIVVLRSDYFNKYVGHFISTLLKKESYRYNYGRAFNKRLIEETMIKLPADKKGQPDWIWIENYIKKSLILKLPSKAKSIWEGSYDISSINSDNLLFQVEKWQWFRYDEIFDICKGFYNKKPENHTGNNIPFIGAIDNNNGVSEYYDIQDIEEASKTGDENNVPLTEKLFAGNCITVSNNGSVGYAFYQAKTFTCSHDVNPLYLHHKWNQELNQYIAMFLCSLIEKERYRWTYGRKWRPKRMPSSLIKLPVDKTGIPDWKYMEDYIKSLPYSANI